MSFRQLIRELKLDDSERHEIRQILHDMVKSGNVIKLKGNRFSLPEERSVISGKLSAHRDGYGFVTPDKKPSGFKGDVFIPARFVGDAMQGDTVLVSVEKVKDDGRAEGRILKVLERRNLTIVGQFKRGELEDSVVPYDSKLPQEITIRDGDDLDAAHDSIVNVEVTQFPHGVRRLRGRVVEVLGFRGDFGIDVEIMIRKHQIPVEFPPAALRQAETCEEEVAPSELAGRMDFRALPIVTIDGETAKDFDDAVHVQKLENGNYLLGVHIADVAHYVTKESALDREAFRRGTSVYFPDRAVPMLPERLSNGICSLKPKVDRLTLSALMEIDPSGNVQRYSIHDGVICSRERMTYTAVGKILIDRAEEESTRYRELVPHFELMREMAMILYGRRQAKGSIDFDLPEPVIAFDEVGTMIGILKSERNIAHRIIEEFMLTANETVARHLFQRRIGSLYRIHETPDPVKVFQFNEIALSFGYSLGRGFSERSSAAPPRLKDRSRHGGRSQGSSAHRDMALQAMNIKVSPKDYQKLVEQITGKPEERILSYLMLRSLKQARYSPQNQGHFGLASSCYTHFTSPIRRYPDLMVHRILKAAWRSKSEAGFQALEGQTHNEGLSPAPGQIPPERATLGLTFALPDAADAVADAKARKELRRSKRKEESQANEVSRGLYSPEALDSIAVHSSEMERHSDEAERELIDLKKLEFMADKLGEEYEGIVIHLTKEGMVVELMELFVEGFARLISLADDDYQLRDRPLALVGRVSGKVYRLGDRLKVSVDRIDRFRRRVDLSVVERLSGVGRVKIRR
ncbi:MAG: VacB/RNase II family 3'-5' exoribonuclease [Acidobacteria bacterium]|nr:VacB/RNase II family 3'-5' exoribonuclease [Acidobacteriota bacterium]